MCGEGTKFFTGVSRAAKSLLYRHDKPNEPTKKGPLPIVLFESPFIPVSTVSKGHPSLVSLGSNVCDSGSKESYIDVLERLLHIVIVPPLIVYVDSPVDITLYGTQISIAQLSHIHVPISFTFLYFTQKGTFLFDRTAKYEKLFKVQWTGTYLTPLSKPVAGEILKDREIGTNPLADRMASIVMLFAGGN